MVDAVMYIYYCRENGIWLGHTEKRIFEAMTTKEGWIDEEDYIYSMEQIPAFHLTKDQIKILRAMPHRFDNHIVWNKKTRELETKILPAIHKKNGRISV